MVDCQLDTDLEPDCLDAAAAPSPPPPPPALTLTPTPDRRRMVGEVVKSRVRWGGGQSRARPKRCGWQSAGVHHMAAGARPGPLPTRRSLSPGPAATAGASISGSGSGSGSASPALLCPPEPRSYGRSPRHSVASVASVGAPLAEADASAGCLGPGHRPPPPSPRPLSPALLEPPSLVVADADALSPGTATPTSLRRCSVC
ncbi:translation initiation factor IF-2-like [Schistocerca serialis cubense]|uniref:translation initiation factor IF-2-like n=1 Tax=Schistocerca serialis cubense TaxID=2023355 RepID=UPI00214F3FDD|nr:translation initiation factor IF-2-like [Schistocerca serialis cubense]